MSGIRYRSEILGARERLESRVIETACGPVEYPVMDEGDPVLVLHGNGGGFDQGLGLARAYIAQGFQVIAPSRFGCLRSPVPEGATPAMQADVYACLLDALRIDRVALFPTSAGVNSSLQLALRHPERITSLIFHSPRRQVKLAS